VARLLRITGLEALVMTRRWMAGAAIAALLAAPASAAADPAEGPIAASAARLAEVEMLTAPAAAEPEAHEPQSDRAGAQDEPRRRSGWWRVLGGAAGGAAGFFGGALIGARIDGDCNGCDDPGLKGAIIGAPVGAAVGAVIGSVYFFR
jgi:hypothetical protein